MSQRDLKIKHEVDNIIVQHIMICAQRGEQTEITVISDHTDVFVLLLHFYHEFKLT
jgi:hypothetical protein